MAPHSGLYNSITLNTLFVVTPGKLRPTRPEKIQSFAEYCQSLCEEGDCAGSVSRKVFCGTRFTCFVSGFRLLKSKTVRSETKSLTQSLLYSRSG